MAASALLLPYSMPFFRPGSKTPYLMALATGLCLSLGRRAFEIRRKHLGFIIAAILTMPFVVYLMHVISPHGIGDRDPPWPPCWRLLLDDSGIDRNRLWLFSCGVWFLGMGLDSAHRWYLARRQKTTALSFRNGVL